MLLRFDDLLSGMFFIKLGQHLPGYLAEMLAYRLHTLLLLRQVMPGLPTLLLSLLYVRIQNGLQLCVALTVDSVKVDLRHSFQLGSVLHAAACRRALGSQTRAHQRTLCLQHDA